MDFFGPLPKSIGGVKYIFVTLDVFSKLVQLYPVRRATTEVIVNRLSKDYFSRVGKPSRILSDHGTQFTSSRWKNFVEESGIRHILSSVRHPQGNPVERVMKEIGRLLRAYCGDSHKGWANKIPLLNRFMNNITHTSTGGAPIEVHYGRPPACPLDACIPAEFRAPTDAHVHLYWAATSLERAGIHRTRSRPEQRPPRFVVGQEVLLKANPHSSTLTSETKKLFPVFEGPYVISGKVGTKTFVLSHPISGNRLGQYHASHLRLFHRSPIGN